MQSQNYCVIGRSIDIFTVLLKSVSLHLGSIRVCIGLAKMFGVFW